MYELRKKDDVKNILLSWAIIRFFKSRPGGCMRMGAWGMGFAAFAVVDVMWVCGWV